MSSLYIRGKFEPDPEEEDPEHEMGITTEGFEAIATQLAELGVTDVEISKRPFID